MSNKVSTKRLGDIVNFKRGYDLPSYNRRDGQYPILSSSGISGYHSEYKVEGEGLVTGRYGTLGEVYYINGKYWPHNTALYVTDFKGNYPKYVYYLMKCLGNLKTSDKSTVPGINRNDLHEIVIPYIEPKFQQKIAAVLSTLDAKIELNQRINAELESMAKTLYDYWFVQFDFHNEKGMPYKSAGGKMVWNEELKREIPLEWEVKSLGSIENNIVTGKTPPTNNPEFYDGNVPFITIGDIRGNMHVINTELKLSQEVADFQTNKYITKGSICVTCIASPGLIGFTTQDSQTNQQINSIVVQKEENRTYLYFALNDYFKFSKGAKTGNTFSNMNKGDFESINLVYPLEEFLLSFDKHTKSSIEQILTLLKETQTLTELRDWLLPMLMNGQVNVEDKEDVSERTALLALDGSNFLVSL